MIAPPTSPYSQFSVHRRLPHHRHAGAPSSRVEQEQFTARLTKALSRARSESRPSMALLTIDLDGFVRVRASFGGAAASRLLVAATNRVRACLAPHDQMARLGGDELHVLVDCDGNASAAWQVAELILHMVTAPYALEDRQVAITACVGIALVRPDHTSASEVVRDAFAALHRARVTGVARCALFDTGRHEASIDQLRLATELRQAIDRGEFLLHYQPILDCRTGNVASVEALIRWEHPSRGRLMPSEFFHALDRSDLMGEVNRWVVAEVAKQVVRWRAEVGLEVSVAINVCPRQLGDSTFLPFVSDTLAAVGASLGTIVFEMTENVELGKGDASLRALREVRLAGIRVFVDDFGTGYSSLSYLQRLAIDGVKLDRSFIDSLDFDARQREIVSAVIRLAHVLDLDVVAEGVERREQLDVLIALGCDHAQGYYFSHPLEPAMMRAWLSDRAAR
jgi:diguanylate cyclase (GGDEF)-like protein